MFRIIGIVLLISGNLFANEKPEEIDLGTLGASAEIKRFGHEFERSEYFANEYIQEMGNRRDTLLKDEINLNSEQLGTNLTELAEKDILRSIFEN